MGKIARVMPFGLPSPLARRAGFRSKRRSSDRRGSACTVHAEGQWRCRRNFAGDETPPPPPPGGGPFGGKAENSSQEHVIAHQPSSAPGMAGAMGRPPTAHQESASPRKLAGMNPSAAVTANGLGRRRKRPQPRTSFPHGLASRPMWSSLSRSTLGAGTFASKRPASQIQIPRPSRKLGASGQADGR